MDRRYYTPREVGDLLRISPTTVMKMIHERRLFAVRVSERIYRIPIAAVVRLQVGEEPSYSPVVDEADEISPVGERVPGSDRQSVPA